MKTHKLLIELYDAPLRKIFILKALTKKKQHIYVVMHLMCFMCITEVWSHPRLSALIFVVADDVTGVVDAADADIAAKDNTAATEVKSFQFCSRKYPCGSTSHLLLLLTGVHRFSSGISMIS